MFKMWGLSFRIFFPKRGFQISFIKREGLVNGGGAVLEKGSITYFHIN